MTRITKFTLKLILLFIISAAFASPTLAKSRNSALRNFGDYAQVINPLISAGIASQEKGAGHFAIIYGQSWITMQGIKLIGSKSKWVASKRPSIEGKRDRYDGMPSGHTNSAWVAAAYTRTFSEDYKYAAIPLYISAALTGYSRVQAKEHTTGQVIAGAALAELFVYINSKMKWSNEYRSTNFYFGKDKDGNGEAIARFEFRL